jgi:hypothetical protein
MAEKFLGSRIIHKHDSQANWTEKRNFVPMQGEIIIYDPDNTVTYARVKIGDGVTAINNLPFLMQDSNSGSVSPEELSSEDWTFTLIDGTTVTKKVAIK